MVHGGLLLAHGHSRDHAKPVERDLPLRMNLICEAVAVLFCAGENETPRRGRCGAQRVLGLANRRSARFGCCR
jgi:hypothetical protein